MKAIDTRPIAYDICCGLGGWTEALLDEGYRVIGFDIEAHDYGTGGYPGELRLQDITTIHGSELKDAALIVCSPPCQRYSYMAMPWSRAKAQAAMIEADTTGEEMRKLNLLFDTCFRLQREASEAAGHHIPMIVENVRGAQKWVGGAKWASGPYCFWGDVPAVMPMGRFTKGMNCGRAADGTRQFGGPNDQRRFSSKSIARRRAAATVAKIPYPLAQHIARTFKPRGNA